MKLTYVPTWHFESEGTKGQLQFVPTDSGDHSANMVVDGAIVRQQLCDGYNKALALSLIHQWTQRL